MRLELLSGEGQLEISINDGDVPNAVQVLGGGKCLVTYTPEHPLTHEIEVTFNGEQVPGNNQRIKHVRFFFKTSNWIYIFLF